MGVHSYIFIGQDIRDQQKNSNLIIKDESLVEILT